MTPRSAARARSPRPSGSRPSATSRSCAEHRCVNESANSVDDNAGAQLFFQGEAAMHPIGSWLVSWAIDGGARPRLRLREPAGHAGGLGRRPGQRHRRRDGLHGQRQQPQHRPGRRVPGAAEQPGERPEFVDDAEIIPLAPSVADAERGRSLARAWASCSTARPRSCCRPTPATTSRRPTSCTPRRPRCSAARRRRRRRSPRSTSDWAASDARVGRSPRAPDPSTAHPIPT